jgi:hypothetical protein
MQLNTPGIHKHSLHPHFLYFSTKYQTALSSKKNILHLSTIPVLICKAEVVNDGFVVDPYNPQFDVVHYPIVHHPNRLHQ